jgi:hypothetical protein
MGDLLRRHWSSNAAPDPHEALVTVDLPAESVPNLVAASRLGREAANACVAGIRVQTLDRGGPLDPFRTATVLEVQIVDVDHAAVVELPDREVCDRAAETRVLAGV